MAAGIRIRILNPFPQRCRADSVTPVDLKSI
jgi:hypothetical protein